MRSSWRRALLRLWALALPAALPAGCGATRADPSEGSDQVAERTGSGQRPIAFGNALVIFGTDTVRAEVARTPEQRERGLMYRTSLPEGTGMLFVFPDAEERSFWMSNTYVALDVAFMDESMRITGIQQMEAESTDYHDSPGPMMYGLEMPKGWFAAHGVKVGDRARLILGTG